MTTEKEDIEELKAEQSIDEGCVGCCKVVDIAARLQEELEDCHKLALNESNRVQCDTELIEKLHMEIHNRDTIIKNFKAIETKETDRLHKIIDDQSKTIHYLKQEMVGRKEQLMGQREATEFREREVHRLNAKLVEHADIIEELKDRNSEDLNELYKLDKEELDQLKHVVSARDLTIKSLTTICQSSGTERNKLTSTINEKDKMVEKQGREISGLLCLRDMYDGLNVELIEKHNRINTLHGLIKGLNVELSTRKQDFVVLKKVVDVANRWSDERIASRPAMNQITYIVKDYHDAPEGPEDTTIDEPQETTATFVFLELP